MRAYRVYEFGEPTALRVDELDELVPAPGEVVADVHAAGVNFPDLLMVAGKYQALPERPFTPGMEFAGVVRRVGDGVTELAPGDRILAEVEYGAFAEQAAALAHRCFKLPDALDFVDAAAMGLVYQTAYFALIERGWLRAGDTVLVGGASGGVGLAAVQIAKALGATVLAAVRSDEAAALVRDSGADHVIDVSGAGLRERLRSNVFAATGGHGADVVIDPVGGDFFAAALRATAWSGRVVVVGFAAGDIPSVKVNYLLVKNIAVTGLQWSDYRDRDPARVHRVQDELFQLWQTGALRPQVMRSFSFDATPEALARVGRGKVLGKVAIDVKGSAV